jgi:hypothetical protein
MQDPLWGEVVIPNSGGEKMKYGGCAVTLAADVTYSNGQEDVTPASIVDSAVNFTNAGGINWANAVQGSGLVASKYDTQLTVDTYNQMGADTSTTYYTGVRVQYTNDPSDEHWVGVAGTYTSPSTGVAYYVVTPTSANDNDQNGNTTARGTLGWTYDAGGNLMVPTSLSSAYVTFSRPAQAGDLPPTINPPTSASSDYY